MYFYLKEIRYYTSGNQQSGTVRKRVFVEIGGKKRKW